MCQNVDNAVVEAVGAWFARPKTVYFVSSGRQTLSPDVVYSGFQSLYAFLSFLSRFISRTNHFRPFGYACLSVGLLQSPAADCIVRCSGPYSLL